MMGINRIRKSIDVTAGIEPLSGSGVIYWILLLNRLKKKMYDNLIERDADQAAAHHVLIRAAHP